jgi:hypothetical protein
MTTGPSLSYDIYQVNYPSRNKLFRYSREAKYHRKRCAPVAPVHPLHLSQINWILQSLIQKSSKREIWYRKNLIEIYNLIIYILFGSNITILIDPDILMNQLIIQFHIHKNSDYSSTSTTHSVQRMSRWYEMKGCGSWDVGDEMRPGESWWWVLWGLPNRGSLVGSSLSPQWRKFAIFARDKTTLNTISASSNSSSPLLSA